MIDLKLLANFHFTAVLVITVITMAPGVKIPAPFLRSHVAQIG